VLGPGREVAADEPAGAPPATASAPFALRILGVPGQATDPRVGAHVEFGIACGFNALWVTTRAVPDRPLAADLLDRLAGWHERGLRVFVEVLAAGGPGRVAGRTAMDDLGRLLGALRERARIRDVVVSFEGAPLVLEDLADIDRYGRVSAPAHLDLLRAVARSVPRDTRVWFRPAVSADSGLDDPSLPYAAALLDGLARVPRRVGIVWSGTAPASIALDAETIHRSRARLGQRPLILADRFPANGSGARMPLALVLGPLRQRAPELAREIAGYLAIPMAELAGSRLSLLSVADFLRDPSSYDPERSRRAAIERLAGPDPRVREALDTQALEWGGWIGGRNYHTAETTNPQNAADALDDPAALASWTWVVRRYPERMEAIARAADRAFADDVLLTMARRLAVARAAPVAAEMLARQGAGRADVDSLLAQLVAERARLSDRPDVRAALDRFLAHAGIRLGPSFDVNTPGPASESPP